MLEKGKQIVKCILCMVLVLAVGLFPPFCKGS